MKNRNSQRIHAWLLLGLLAGGIGRAQDKAPAGDSGKPASTTTAASAPAETGKDAAPAEAADSAKSSGAEAEQSSDAPAPSRTAERPGAGSRATRPAGSDKMLRLNFRGVPLDMVLNYLSEAAGFIIVLDTEVRGKVDVWSNQPVTQEEALTILDSVLGKNGYSAIRNGRTLTIVSKDSAKRRDIPVKSGNNPALIPKSEEIVTQIIPVRFISASQLMQNLQPLLPTGSELTANEAGNALIMTDTQASIRHIAEIIRALDTSISGATTIRVFPLQFADAKELATVIKELFPAADTRTGGNAGGGNTGGFNRGGFGQGGGFPGGGFPGGGGFGGNGGGGRGGTGATGRTNTRVVAVADEHSNSLVVNAPDDVLPEIEELINKVDTNVEDVTELRVFRLRYADPSEMAEVLTGLFPDDTRTSNNNRQQVRFGGFGGFGGGNRNTAAASDSDRAKKKGRVLAVPDQRTSSVIVSAARDLMGQIGEMVAQLDSNPARKQKVFVYDLQNADPQQVQDVLNTLFPSPTSMNRNTRTANQNQSSALTTRANQSQNNNRSGNTGFGAGGGGGGFGTGGGRTGGN